MAPPKEMNEQPKAKVNAVHDLDEEDAWLKLHEEVVATLRAQNNLLVSLRKKQEEYVRKEDLKEMKEQIREKIFKVIPSVANKIVETLKKEKAEDDDSRAHSVQESARR